MTVMPRTGTPLSPTQARARPQAGLSSFPGCTAGLFGWSMAIPHPSAQKVGEDFSIRPNSLFEGFLQQAVNRRNHHSKRGKIRVRIPVGGQGLQSAPRQGEQRIAACRHTSCPGAEQEQALPRPCFYMSMEQQVGKPHFWCSEVAVTLLCLRMLGFLIKQGL